MQALTEFTFRARIREVTDMRVNIRPSASDDLQEEMKIMPDNLAHLQMIEVSFKTH